MVTRSWSSPQAVPLSKQHFKVRHATRQWPLARSLVSHCLTALVNKHADHTEIVTG